MPGNGNTKSNGNGNGNGHKQGSHFGTHLIAGGTAGMMEALTCHPLDTIKVRMQLSRRQRLPGVKPRSFFRVGADIVKRETPLGLYKGLGAVLTGIIPKMAIRFSGFEAYKSYLAPPSPTTGRPPPSGVFLSGLLAGATEAILVVTPMEVVKIRLQAQVHSLSDPLEVPKYRNAAHCVFTMVREEGVGSLYRGVGLTVARQASNQAVSFTTYTYLKDLVRRLQHTQEGAELPSYQHLLLGLISGACGPLTNAPIDTIKTRLQRGSPSPLLTPPRGRAWALAREMWQREGVGAFWKGISPRVLRVAPGQAVTFMVYERVKGWLEGMGSFEGLGKEYEE